MTQNVDPQGLLLHVREDSVQWAEGVLAPQQNGLLEEQTLPPQRLIGTQFASDTTHLALDPR